MPVKKTVAQKPTTKTATKNASTAKVVEVKKPTVVVETKKTERCECGDNCNCGMSCDCGCCKCGCIWKICILVLIIANLVLSCCLLCFKGSTGGRSAWDLEALKVGGEDNLKKLEQDLYNSDTYKNAQKESIQAYLDQLGID